MAILSAEEIIAIYDNTLKDLDSEAKSQSDRAYGGYLRSEKGKLSERIAEELVRLAWHEIGGKPDELEINKKKLEIPIEASYIQNIKNDDVKQYIVKSTQDTDKKYIYRLSVDKHIYIRNKFVMGIECKSYAENAMLKRICVDFYLLKKLHPEILCYLVQLESQLGGDYSQLHEVTYGSPATHTILSYFPIDLKIITLLEGERNIDKPIHRYYKPLRKKHLLSALRRIKSDLSKFIKN